MNYVSAVYGVVVVVIIVDWLVRGRTHYLGQDQRHEETKVLTEDMNRRASVISGEKKSAGVDGGAGITR